MKKHFLTLLLIGILSSCKHETMHFQFTWKNVLIGGGGYVTGLVMHPSDPDLWYVRTDVGAAYRYDKEKNMLLPITNWISIEESNLYGVYGIALDPSDENIVFIAAGRYPHASPSDVLESHDKGFSWKRLGLDKPFGANKHPEKIGKKLVLNPHNNNELWCGTMGEGLWIYSRDRREWNRNISIPEDANIQSIVFDKRSIRNVFVATRNYGMLSSFDAGNNFQKIPGSPERIIEIDLSRNGDVLYVCSSDRGLMRLKNPFPGNGWESISPEGSEKDAAYRIIYANPHSNSGVLTVNSRMDGLRKGFFVSDDAGTSWKRKEAKINQQIPWHRDDFPGSAVSSITIDPVYPATVYITDWFSVFKSDNLFDDTLIWSNKIARGHEELVCLNMAAPPKNFKGIQLYSAQADVGGFAHVNPDEYPLPTFRNGADKIKNTTGIDFCEVQPNVVYRLGSTDHGGENTFFARSTDFGESWEICPGYNMAWQWGRIAVSSSNPDIIIAATKSGGIVRSCDGGATWRKTDFKGATGLNGPVFRYGYPLAADRSDGRSFYFYGKDDQSFYRSNDFGKSWNTVSVNMPMPDSAYFRQQLDLDFYRLMSVPGNKGHLLLALANAGLFRSRDGGNSWEQIKNITECPLITCGKEAPGSKYPTLFMLGKYQQDKQLWYYFSLDQGETWKRMNDRSNRLGNNPQVLEGDRGIFGRVYIGTNGSGIIFSELKNNAGK